MKKFIVTLGVTMLATHLPAPPAPPINLSILTTSDGGLQILTSGVGSSPYAPTLCVLQSTTDFVNWTSVKTNVVSPSTGTITNLVEPTNSMMFYRAYIPVH